MLKMSVLGSFYHIFHIKFQCENIGSYTDHGITTVQYSLVSAL